MTDLDVVVVIGLFVVLLGAFALDAYAARRRRHRTSREIDQEIDRLRAECAARHDDDR